MEGFDGSCRRKEANGMNLQHLLLPLSFSQWCERSLLGHSVKYSRWEFAILETFHIIGITVLLGSTLVVDLRLLGFSMRQISAAQLAREFAPWSWAALSFMFVTGIPMFLSEAVRMSLNSAFLFKMILLCLALLIHFTIRRRATRPGAKENARFGKLAACLSLMSWLSVALAGRAIAFFMTLNGA
jgi:hypothetical protein